MKGVSERRLVRDFDVSKVRMHKSGCSVKLYHRMGATHSMKRKKRWSQPSRDPRATYRRAVREYDRSKDLLKSQFED